jgi:trehalose-6-phosphatase
VVVSGRRAKEVARLLELKKVEIWGSHGLERLTPEGMLELDHIDSRTMQAVTRANVMLERAGLAKLFEHKPFGNAVHWRGFSVERAMEAQESVEEVWAAIPGKSLLRMLRFDGGIEICAASANKERVVHRVAAELGGQYSMAYPFLQHSIP